MSAGDTLREMRRQNGLDLTGREDHEAAVVRNWTITTLADLLDMPEVVIADGLRGQDEQRVLSIYAHHNTRKAR